MPSNGGYREAPPSNGGDRFYYPAAMRQPYQRIIYHHPGMMQLQQLAHHQQNHHHHQHQQNQQWEHQMRTMMMKRRDGGDFSNAGVRLSIPRPLSFRAPSFEATTNLDRVLDSVSPFVQAQFLSEANRRGYRTREVDSHPYFNLGDLWESFDEGSAYGFGVPLLLHGTEPTDQFFVPFLSGIQLYVDQSKSSSRLRVSNEGSDALSYRLTGSAGSSNLEGDRRPKSLMSSNMQQFDKLSLEDKSSYTGTDIAKLPLNPVYSFLESEAPHNRQPLASKIFELCKEYPDLAKLRSCDLLPTSWICVAWYPIYRIPMGSTLRDLDCSFLSFHSLSTQPRSNGQPKFHAPNTRRVKGFVDPAPRISLPVFALAAYKLEGSIVSPCGPHEREQEKSLEQAADSWLRRLKVQLPDYNFFRSHSHPRR